MNYSQIVSSWVEVSKQALEHNVAQYKALIGDAKLAVVIKSNAYGCDLTLVAKILDINSQVDYLCVASLTEARYLRTIGIQKALLMFGIVDCDLQQAVMHDIEVTCYDIKTALELDCLGQLYHKKVKIHIKIDTGMSRLGLFYDQVLNFVQAVRALKFIELVGIFTHFAASDRADLNCLDQQLAIFNRIIADLERHKIVVPLKHTANTAAITAKAITHFNMVRVGIGAYGMWPSPENQLLTNLEYPDFNLLPVLTWKTKVLTVKDLPAGSYVGYDQAYQTVRPTKIATIPVGYYDGYDRRLSNQGQVLVHQQIAPVIGNIAMNITMIDVTGIELAIGDEVILLGNVAGVQADDLALICQTANTEITARINPLIIRKLVF